MINSLKQGLKTYMARHIHALHHSWSTSTLPATKLLQSFSTPRSTLGRGPIGVIAFGLISE